MHVMLRNAKSAAVQGFRMTSLLFLGILLFGVVATASADTIGIAVGGVGLSTQVGLTPAADGTISYYVPLTTSDSGVYGARGTTSDTCSYSSTCTGGYLDMFLRFAPVQVGANVLTLNFSDLDLKGANDPTYFLESVTIIPTGGSSVLIDETTDPGVLSANNATQVLVLPMAVASNPFYVQLHFTSSFLSTTPSGTYANTIETVQATIKPVPEPLTLATLGLGLLAIGILSRRKGSITLSQ